MSSSQPVGNEGAAPIEDPSRQPQEIEPVHGLSTSSDIDRVEPVVPPQLSPKAASSSEHISKILLDNEGSEGKTAISSEKVTSKKTRRRKNVIDSIRSFRQGRKAQSRPQASPKARSHNSVLSFHKWFKDRRLSMEPSLQFIRGSAGPGVSSQVLSTESVHGAHEWFRDAQPRSDSQDTAAVPQSTPRRRRNRCIPCFTRHEKLSTGTVPSPAQPPEASSVRKAPQLSPGESLIPSTFKSPVFRSDMFELDAMEINAFDISSWGPEVAEAWKVFQDAYAEGSDSSKILRSLIDLAALTRDITVPGESQFDPKAAIQRLLKKWEGADNVLYYVDLQDVGREFNITFRELRNAVYDLRVMHPNNQIEGLDRAWKKLDQAVRDHAPYGQVLEKAEALEKVLNDAQKGGYTNTEPVLVKLDYFKVLFSKESSQAFGAQDWLLRKAELDKYIQPVNDLTHAWESMNNVIHISDPANEAFRELVRILKSPQPTLDPEKVPKTCWKLLNTLDYAQCCEKKYNWGTFGLKNIHIFKPEDLQPVKERLKVIAHEYMAPAEAFHFSWRTLSHHHQMPHGIRHAHKALINALKADDSPSKAEFVSAAAQDLKKAMRAASANDGGGRKHRKGINMFKRGSVFKIGELRPLEEMLDKAFIRREQPVQREIFVGNVRDEGLQRVSPEIRNKATNISFMRAMAFHDLEKERNAEKTLSSEIDDVNGTQSSPEKKFTRYLELLEVGWNELVDKLKQDHKYRSGLSPETDMAWLELINNLHHGGAPKHIIDCFKSFINLIEGDLAALKQAPSNKSNQLGRYAEMFMNLAEKKTEAFDNWLQSISVPSYDSFTDALADFDLKSGSIKDKHSLKTGPIGQGGGTTFHWMAGPVGKFEAQVAAVEITALGMVLGPPASGGADFLGKIGDATAGAMSKLGFAVFNVISTYSEVGTLRRHRKLKKTGLEIEQAGLKAIEELNKEPDTPDVRKFRDTADIAVALGRTMYNGGTLSHFEQFLLTLDIVRRLGAISTGVLGTVALFGGLTAAAAPPLLITSAVLSGLGVICSLHDSVRAFEAAAASAEHKALMSKRLTRLVKSMDTNKLKLEPAVETLIRRASNDEALAKGLGQAEWLFTTGFVFGLATSVMGAVADSAAPGSGTLIKTAQILAGVGVAEAATYGLWTLVMALRHVGQEVIMYRGAKRARKAYNNYNKRNDDNDSKAFQAHETYKKRLTKKNIHQGIKKLRHDMGQISKNLKETNDGGVQIRDISSVLRRVDHEVNGQKFDPSIGSGLRRSEWELSELQNRADSVGAQIDQFRPKIAQSLAEAVTGDLQHLPDFRDNPEITEQLEKLVAQAGNGAVSESNEDSESESVSESNDQSGSIRLINPLSDQIFSTSKAILNKVIQVLDHDLPGVTEEAPGEGRLALERAKAALGDLNLDEAANHLAAVLKHRPSNEDPGQYKHLRDLTNTVTRHMTYTRRADSVGLEMFQIGIRGNGDDPDSSGPAKLAADHVSRELLREDPYALPTMLLWMLQSKDPVLAKNASDTLLALGATRSTLSRLHGNFSVMAVNYVAQLIGTPPAAGGGPVVGVVDSMPAKDLAFDAAWEPVLA